MHQILWLLYIAIIWYKKSTSLPKLYFAISNRRDVTVRDLRQIEKFGYKVLKLRLDVKYFKTCTDLGLCPQFLKFKAPKLKVYKNSSELYQIVVSKKLKEVRKDLARTEIEYVRKKSVLQHLGIVEKRCLSSLLQDKFQKAANNTIVTYKKKLTQLWLKQRRCSPECIINVSKRELTILEKETLRFGRDNHILPNKPKVDDIKCSIERTLHSLKTIEGLAVDDEIRDEIKFATMNFTNNAKILCSDRKNTALHRTLYNLSQEPDIKVCSFDKGRGVVIMDSNDYYSKLDDIVNDQSKFHELKVNSKIHPVIAKEKSISCYVRKYLKDFGPETMRRLIPSGSNPGKIYGLVKIHKRDNPLRPVVSMIGTPEYQLAKFLDSLIKPYIPQTYML